MRLSFFSFLICAVLIGYSGSVFYPRWEEEKGEAQISYDASGYYWYLPSIFIYHDIKGQHFKDSILQKYQPVPPNDFQQGFLHSSGNYVMKYSPGLAILEMPFFFVANTIAKPLGYPADGFSRPYQLMIYLGGILFVLLGLWYLRKLLLYYYNDKIVAIVLLLLVFGTNYLNYAGIDVGMTHAWLFTLYVFILLNTHHFYKTLNKKYVLRLGGLIGITALVRPPEIISVLIPLLWGMESIKFAAIKERFLFLKKQIRGIIPAAILCVAILSIQFIYWKYASGDWFVYSYQNQGFSWLHPHLKLYALNFQCGWLTYTPMMIIAMIGIWAFLKNGKNKVAILVLILLNYYIVSAWDAWDYGGRAMIQNYPILLFPLASFIQYISRKKLLVFIFTPIILLFTYFNLWWTYQAHRGTLIGSVPATSSYYWATIFRYNVPLDVQKLRDNKYMFTDAIQHPVLLYSNDFGKGKIIVGKDTIQSFTFAKPQQDFKWIRASADIHIDQKEWNVWYMTQFMVKLKKGNHPIQEDNIRLQRLLNDGDTKNITIDIKVGSQDYDHIEIDFRNDNAGTIPCTISNLKVIGFND